MSKETQIEKAIKHFVILKKGWCQKVHSGSVMISPPFGKRKYYKMNLAEAGTPDLIACMPIKITKDMVGETFGLFCGIEVKKDEKEVKKWVKYNSELIPGDRGFKKRENAQKIQGQKIQKSGGKAFIVSSIDDLNADFKHLSIL